MYVKQNRNFSMNLLNLFPCKALPLVFLKHYKFFAILPYLFEKNKPLGILCNCLKIALCDLKSRGISIAIASVFLIPQKLGVIVRLQRILCLYFSGYGCNTIYFSVLHCTEKIIIRRMAWGLAGLCYWRYLQIYCPLKINLFSSSAFTSLEIIGLRHWFWL